MDYSEIPCIEIASEIRVPKARKAKEHTTEEQVWCANMIMEFRMFEQDLWNSLCCTADNSHLQESDNCVRALKRVHTIIHELEYLSHLV